MMKQAMLLLVVGLMIGTSIMAAADKILPYPINQKQLANGLNVVTVQFDSPGLAAFFVVERVGSRNEIEAGVT